MISSNEFFENFQKATLYYQEILQYIMEHKIDTLALNNTNNKRNQEMIAKMLEQAFEHPEKFTSLNVKYISDFQKLILDSVNRFMGQGAETASSDNSVDKFNDKRFKDAAWSQNVYFDFIKQYYLLTSEWMQNTAEQYELDDSGQKYIEFITQQFIDASSPANFAFTNPEVIKESLDSGLANIVHGMENFLKDIKTPGGLFNVSTTDKRFFNVGRNIAATPGKVVYENELMQLICYKPKEKTHAIPVFIIPPWINKYYILDLSEKNSLVKWLVDNNFQVFLVSWVNPTKKLASKKFEDYFKEGILDPYEHIKKMGFNKINAMGYCIGGTLLAMALAYLKNKKKDYVNSATFLTTLIDFSDPGEIGAFVNQDSIKTIEEAVRAKGYLDGKFLSNSFSLIRANDLIWSFFVNNYLLGKTPTAFDILYWNSDSTNLPADMYIYYLRNMYLDNKLIQPNALEMFGQKIDLSVIDVPSFSLAAKGDHIALWKIVYDGYKYLNGDKTFCLTDAGHVAGVVNPANNTKYSYLISNDVTAGAEKWAEQSLKHNGSWWNAWGEWLQTRSGKLEKSLDYDTLDFIEMAPGRYVKK